MCVLSAQGYRRSPKWLLSDRFVCGIGAYLCLLCLQRDAPHRAAKRLLNTRSLLGSTNFDPRSFSLNDEANVNFYDVDFARRQIGIFLEDLAHSRQVTFQEWKDRPLAEKLWEYAATLFGSQL
jgi:phosphatidylserine/phosphatidylglycerophosphate/cardiolipin synthase-like enzyme